MPYSSTKLVIEAFYTSGIVSRQFQTVAGDQFAVGLDKLNEILSDTTIESDMIPYFNTAYNFNAVAGQEKYFIPNLVEAETLTFFINQVRYAMRRNPRDQYFGMGRAENIQSLPFNWHVEKTRGGSNLFMYFFPDENFPLQITGLFSLQTVVDGQDLMAANTSANLGTAFFTPVAGLATIVPGALVINGFDLQGAYASTQALITAINTNIPTVIAFINGTDFILMGAVNSTITIVTNGLNAFNNNITFQNFSTINGANTLTFMPQALDQFYINYLQYRLAERLCAVYNFAVPELVAKQLLSYQQMISKRSSPVDFSMIKITTLNKTASINYGQVNLGKGWTSV